MATSAGLLLLYRRSRNEGQRFRLAPFLKVVIIMFRAVHESSGAVFKFNHRVIW